MTNVGTPAAAIFDFGIPEGEQGQSGSGSGDVVGPGSATPDAITLFDGSSGTAIKDSATLISDLATSAQGGLADSALQSVVGGTGITVDATDPQNPTINADGGGGSGDVVGPPSSQDNHLAVWDGINGELLKDSAKDVDDVVTNTGTATSANFAAFNGGSGKVIQDAGVGASSFVSSSLLGTINSALQPTDDISELTNDAGYLDGTTGVEPGDNVSTLTNDAGYITAGDVPADAVASVFTRTGAVVAEAGDYSAFYATVVQGGLADSATQPGDNVSTLTNDAGYLDSAAGNAAYLAIDGTAVESTEVTGQEGGGASWKIFVGGSGPGNPGDGTIYFRTS